MSLISKDPAEGFFRPESTLDWRAHLDDPDPSALHHIARYEWACLVAQARGSISVLDIACGSGYGTKMLADRLPYANVVGVDVDPEAVALGMQYASSDNCSFFVGDLATWCVQVEGRVEPLPQFDLVVCFDTIEHTTHRDLAWQRLRSGVTAGGAVLLSTPVRPEETDLNPPWHAHSVEYGHVDLMGIATTHFREVLMPLDSDFPYREFWDQVNHGRMRYWNVANPLVMSH